MSDYARPLNYRILVKPDEVQKETESGIQQMTETEWEMFSQSMDIGTILRLGPNAFDEERFSEECLPKEGDRVRFRKFAGHVYREKNKFGFDIGPYFRIMNDEDILQVIEEAQE